MKLNLLWLATVPWVSLPELPSAGGEMMPTEERRAGYAARNYSWPIPDEKIQPPTSAWIQLIRNRIRQVEAAETVNRLDKYDAWRSVLGQAVVVPNYTQYGWAVTRAPSDLVGEIQGALRANFNHATPEGFDPCIVGGREPAMVDIGNLADQALLRMQPYLEAWSGTKLIPIKGYGLRLYFNNSQLYMHLDRTESHVISSIIHIDRSVDFRPESFPLVIEDLEGTTQHVQLDLGDAFFYESAKCLHGRPVPLDGSWFTSLFLHYAPHDWPMQQQKIETEYAVPDHWEEVRPYDDESSHNLPRLSMVDTGLLEPDCPNLWCGTGRTASWKGPARAGVVISSHGQEQELHIGEDSKPHDEL